MTHEAVALQRKMNDIYSNGKLTSDLPPIHITPPSMGSVLEMLNTINGILFVHIRWAPKLKANPNLYAKDWLHSTAKRTL